MRWRTLSITLGLFLLWQLGIWLFQTPSYILPSPIAVLTSLYHNGNLLYHEAIPTLIETLMGLAIGILWGAIVAISMSLWRPVQSWTLPLIIGSQAIPTFAIAPILVIWLGYGIASKIATSVLILFFPVTAAFYDGLKHIKLSWLDLAQINQANRYRTMLYIRLPAALPALATGIRMAAVWAPIGAVMGEWVGSSRGLGFLILESNARMNTQLMFAAIFVLIIISGFLYFLTDRILAKLVPWQTLKN